MTLSEIKTEIKDTVKQIEQLKKRLETLYVLRNIELEKQSGQMSIEDYVK